MRRRKAFTVGLCLVALAGSCSSGTGPGVAAVAGTYDLVLVDEAPPPYTSYALKDAVTYYGGTLTLGSDGRSTLTYDNGLGSAGYGHTGALVSRQ